MINVFCHASFAGYLEDSKSTSRAGLCLMGPSTFVFLSWMCKKQGAVAHSSTEAEIISLEAALRMEGMAALELWDRVINVLCPENQSQPNENKHQTSKKRE